MPPPEPRRVLGLFAHVDAGKTTLAEQLLHLGGVVRRAGSVEGGNTVTDWREDEQARGITISTAAASLLWQGVALDLLDTPGHIDFGAEVSAALAEIDGAVLIVSAPDGVQARTLAIWHMLRSRQVPTVVFVNKIDSGHVALGRVLDSLRDALEVPLVPVNWPEIEEDADSFTWYGAWDVLSGRWHDAEGPPLILAPSLSVDATPDPAVPQLVREAAIQWLLEQDDALLGSWLDDAELAPAELLRSLAAATSARAVCPVVFGAAALGLGVDTLLSTLARCLPAPTLPPDDGRGAWVRVLKRDLLPPPCPGAAPEVLVHARLLSGSLARTAVFHRSGSDLPVPTQGLGPILGREVLSSASVAPGALFGFLLPLADAIALHPGELLATAPGLTPSPAVARPPADPIPSPTVWCALDAADAVRHDALLECLRYHSALDPSLAVRRDPRSGQILIGGPGELHLEVLHDRLVRELRAPDLRRGPIRVERTRVLRFPVTVQAEVVDATAAARHLIVLTFAPTALSSLGLPAALSLGQAQIGALEAGLAFSVDVSLGSEEASGPLAVTVDRLEGPGPAGETPPPVLRELAAKAAAAAVATGQWRYEEPWVQCLASVPWPAIGRFQGALARRGVRALTPLDSTHGCQNFQGRVPLRLLIGFPSEFLVLTAGFGCVALTPCAAPDPSQHDDDNPVTETA